ncbi:hypothetical protein [Streptomyces yangpuensis]|uniref:hypothetical protein n=1 Tax=Streptomyces yangpuensis TaxID=1648182 RepID=UPI0035DA3516
METVEFLEYLFGSGERDEHTGPHLIAAWDRDLDLDLPCPARDPGRMSLAGLGLLLDAPVEGLRGPRPQEHVWHVSVRNAPGGPHVVGRRMGGGRYRDGARRGHRPGR